MRLNISKATHDGFCVHALALAAVFERVTGGLDREQPGHVLGDRDDGLLKNAIGPAIAFMWNHPEIWCAMGHEVHGPDCTKGMDVRAVALGASLIFSPLMSGVVALRREGGGSPPANPRAGRVTPRILPGRPRPPRAGR